MEVLTQNKIATAMAILVFCGAVSASFVHGLKIAGAVYLALGRERSFILIYSDLLISMSTKRIPDYMAGSSEIELQYFRFQRVMDKYINFGTHMCLVFMLFFLIRDVVLA